MRAVRAGGQLTPKQTPGPVRFRLEIKEITVALARLWLLQPHFYRPSVGVEALGARESRNGCRLGGERRSFISDERGPREKVIDAEG